MIYSGILLILFIGQYQGAPYLPGQYPPGPNPPGQYPPPQQPGIYNSTIIMTSYYVIWHHQGYPPQPNEPPPPYSQGQPSGFQQPPRPVPLPVS